MSTQKINTNGTCLQGYVRATRREIVAKLGEPTTPSLSGGKTTTEWSGRVGGVVFTIYDYKERQAPGLDEKYDWHIGGYVNNAAQLVGRLLGKEVEND